MSISAGYLRTQVCKYRTTWIRVKWRKQMVKELVLTNWNKVAPLFASHILARSVIHPCIQTGLGSIVVDDVDSPTVAMYSTPLMVFAAGNPQTSSAKELVASIRPYVLLTASNKNWKHLLKREWRDRLVTDIRTHLDHSTLDIHHLRNLKKLLEPKYTLKKLDLNGALQIKEDYSIPIRLYFGSIENLVEKGLGFCIMDEEKVVSLAYTPFPFIDEFEIQVYTEDLPEYRRKGLATVVSAALLEYGLEKGLVPHWDAANENSVKLALKLGYSNPKTWEAFYCKSE